MEECERKMIMLLKQLVINGLHDNYDYDVKFNDDVTFIYGMNGCGKTTVLNITEAIITGRVYRLLDYKFKEITLWYSTSSHKKKQCISAKRKDEGIHVTFAEENAVIRNLLREREMPSNFDLDDVDRVFFTQYPVLKKIKDNFNHAYLPLNRSTHFENDNIIFKIQRNLRYHADNRAIMSNQDIVMLKVEELIRRKYSEIMSEIAQYNIEFRNEILKSLLTVNKGNSVLEALDAIGLDNIEENEIKRIKENYIKILKQLNIIKAEEEKTYRESFDGFINEYKVWKNSNNKKESIISLTSQYTEILRLQTLVSIAERAEKKKNEAYKSIETFVATINSFIDDEIDEKRIHISANGEVYFTIRNTEQWLKINSLSSGEKQLVIFFASLIFEIQKDTTGIFIVDEPELSLHLSWQSEFVKKALDLNENIQLIFATHSPEIVGKYRNKMFKLERKISSKETGSDA